MYGLLTTDDQDKYAQVRPQYPHSSSTPRERRLYERNIAKFDREALQKYKNNRAAWSKQQALVDSLAFAPGISRGIVLKLPKLEHLSLHTIGGCRHALSKRFLQEFDLTLAMPMDQDTQASDLQLSHLILPAGEYFQAQFYEGDLVI